MGIMVVAGTQRRSARLMETGLSRWPSQDAARTRGASAAVEDCGEDVGQDSLWTKVARIGFACL